MADCFADYKHPVLKAHQPQVFWPRNKNKMCHIFHRCNWKVKMCSQLKPVFKAVRLVVAQIT